MTEEHRPRGQRWTEMLTRAQRGDRASFDALVDEAYPVLWARAFHKFGDETGADDLAAEALGKAWRNLAGYDPAESNGRTWLCMILDRLVVDAVKARKAKSHKQVAGLDALPTEDGDEGGVEPEDDVEPAPPDHADRWFRRGLLADGLRALEPDDRRLLVLREVEGRSYEEIAALLGCSVQAVGPRLSRARERLRDALHPEAGPP
jgi:RNA polymerase sigma-70 factor (ECF subfamily)